MNISMIIVDGAAPRCSRPRRKGDRRRLDVRSCTQKAITSCVQYCDVINHVISQFMCLFV